MVFGHRCCEILAPGLSNKSAYRPMHCIYSRKCARFMVLWKWMIKDQFGQARLFADLPWKKTSVNSTTMNCNGGRHWFPVHENCRGLSPSVTKFNKFVQSIKYFFLQAFGLPKEPFRYVQCVSIQFVRFCVVFYITSWENWSFTLV